MKSKEEIYRECWNNWVTSLWGKEWATDKAFEEVTPSIQHIYEAMELYAQQKLNIASVSGKHLPSFLYEEGNNIRVGVHGDTNITEEWQAWLNACAISAVEKTVSVGCVCGSHDTVTRRMIRQCADCGRPI